MSVRMIPLKSPVLGCVILLLAFGVEKADGYSYKVKKGTDKKIVWANKQVKWRAGEKSFPAGDAGRDALVTTNFYWNRAPANFTFGIRNWGEKHISRGNGENEICFSNSQDALQGKPAICYRWLYSSGGKLWWEEADIVFDASILWSPYQFQYDLWPYGGPYRPFITTAIHEMGHALGLGHENRWYNVMGDDFTHVHTNNTWTRGYVGADATQGAVFLYGVTTTSGFTADLAVTHWKYGGSSGEYSTHTPTVIYHPDMSVVYWDTHAGFPRYHVKTGLANLYYAEFTYENNGFSTQYNIKVRYYVSTNINITTADQLIGWTEISQLTRGAAWTTTRPVVFPVNLNTGQTYYLGVIIDYQNDIKEFTELNNATFLQIKIVP